jgi:hypothetical protein
VTTTELYAKIGEALEEAVGYGLQDARVGTAQYAKYIAARKNLRDLLLPAYRSENSPKWVFQDEIIYD